MQTLLEVGRHSWAGQDFHRQGVQQYCRAVMGCCEEDTVSPKSRRLHKRIAEGIRLPGQKAMENFAAAYEGRLRVNPAHRGIVYLVVPEGCKLPEGKARHISEQVGWQPLADMPVLIMGGTHSAARWVASFHCKPMQVCCALIHR
jgi:hypothetical protein